MGLSSLHAFNRLSTSGRSLVAVLKHVRDVGLPSRISRGSFQRARKSIAKTQTPYGPLVRSLNVKLDDDSDGTIHVQDPFAMLHLCAGKSSSFSRLLKRTSWARRGHKWTIVVYNDEVSPTNPLKSGTDRRKVEVFYWSFADFGADVLCNDRLWFVLTVSRSLLAHRMKGGMTALLRTLLHECFFNCHGRAGIHLVLQNEEAFHIQLANDIVLLGDIPALKQCISWKGHSGRMCCFSCKNITAKRGRGVGLCITSTNVAQMEQYTDASLRQTYQRLIDRKNSGHSVGALETALGWVYSISPLVMDVEVFTGVDSCVMLDWCHIYFCGGLFAVEVGCLMQSLWDKSREHALNPITYSTVHDYLQKWTWPRAHASPRQLCEAGNARSWWKSSQLGGTASEQLSFAPVFGRFVSVVVAVTALGEFCDAEIKSLFALLSVIELLYATMRGQPVHHTVLYQHQVKHLVAFKSAYGDDAMIPKHHYSLHLSKWLSRHLKRLFSCWVHERRHAVVRRHCLAKTSLVGYEEGMLEAITADNYHDLNGDLDLWMYGGLIPPVYKAPQKMHKMLRNKLSLQADASIYTANAVHSNACSFRKKDLAIVDIAALPSQYVGLRGAYGFAEVWFHFRTDAGTFTCISPWPVAEQDMRNVVLATEDNPIVVSSDVLLAPLIWMRASTSSIALLPLEYQ